MTKKRWSLYRRKTRVLFASLRRINVQPPSVENKTIAPVQWYAAKKNVAQVPQLGHRLSAGKQGGDHRQLNRTGVPISGSPPRGLNWSGLKAFPPVVHRPRDLTSPVFCSCCVPDFACYQRSLTATNKKESTHALGLQGQDVAAIIPSGRGFEFRHRVSLGTRIRSSTASFISSHP